MADGSTTVLRADAEDLAGINYHLPVWSVFPPVPLQLKCIAIRGDVIVLGTHLDVVIVYYRASAELQKISLEEAGIGKFFASKHKEGVSAACFSPVTPAGTSRAAIGRCCGSIHVIQFSERETERKSTVIASLHKDAITAFEWDSRGMMLFSADTGGRVHASHLDMKDGKHSSWLVHDARQHVTQLSISGMMLMVVSADGCTLCHIHQNVFQKRPAKINQNKPQSLQYRGGVMVKQGPTATCYLACQTFNFLQASPEGQVVRVTPLLHQVEFGTFDTVTLPTDRPATTTPSTEAVQAAMEFGRVLSIGDYLVVWCEHHVWLIQPNPAVTVISACITPEPSEIVDVCTDDESLFVLRHSCGKQSPLLRVLVSQSSGVHSTSASRSGSVHQVTTAASADAGVAKTQSASAIQASATSATGTDAATATVSGDGKQRSSTVPLDDVATSTEHDAGGSPSSQFFGKNASAAVSDFTDRFKHLMSKGSSGGGAAGAAAAAAATGSAPHDDERLAAVVTSDDVIAPSHDASGASHTHTDAVMKPSSSQAPTLATQSSASGSSGRPDAAPSSAGWMDKLRSRGSVPSSVDNVENSPSPAMPAPEVRNMVRQWMADDTPSMGVNDDDLVVAPTVVKKKKKKRKGHKEDDAVAVASPLPPSVASGRERSDSGMSGDGGHAADSPSIAARHFCEPSRTASDMLRATQVALQRSISREDEPQVSSAQQQHLSRSSPTPATVQRDTEVQSVGEVTQASSTSAVHPFDAFGRSNMVATNTLQDDALPAFQATSSPTSSLPRSPMPFAAAGVSSGDGDGGGGSDAGDPSLGQSDQSTTARPRSNADTCGVAALQDIALADGRARAVSELSSADELVQSWASDPNASATGTSLAGHNSQEEAETVDGSDLVHQKYDASLPAHLLSSHASHSDDESGADAAGSVPNPSSPLKRSYSIELGLDSASKLSPPSRRHLASVAMTRSHVWLTDSGEYIYSWSVDTLEWIYIKGAYAVKLAASQTSSIVWALSRQGIVAARVGMAAGVPLGKAWLKLGKLRMKCVAIDGETAWLVTRDGQLLRRRGLSLLTPLGDAWHEEASSLLAKSIAELAAGNGVLWALTAHGKHLVRMGICDSCPLGASWQEVDNPSGVSSICISPSGHGWCINNLGAACFMPDVSPDTPSPDGKQWWQVSLGQQLMKEGSILSTIKDASARVTSLWSSKHSDLERPVKVITCSQLGVSVITSSSALLFSTCDMVGMTYHPPAIAALASTAIWLLTDASTAYHDSGLVWLLSPTGELFGLPRGGRPAPIQLPEGQLMQRLSASNRCVFGLSGDGTLFMRTGVSPYCATGTGWDAVSLPSSMATPVSISCGNTSAWLVDNKGQTWMRACQGEEWAEEWQSVGHPGHIKLVQVVVGPGGWHVWACDASGDLHVRTGIAIETPTGTGWQTAPDIVASDVSISDTSVWVRCTNGDIVRRAGVSPINPVGNYWRRIPGSFAAVSATPDDDELWLLDDNGRLFIRDTIVYSAPTMMTATMSDTAGSDSGAPENKTALDTWEFV